MCAPARLGDLNTKEFTVICHWTVLWWAGSKDLSNCEIMGCLMRSSGANKQTWQKLRKWTNRRLEFASFAAALWSSDRYRKQALCCNVVVSCSLSRHHSGPNLKSLSNVLCVIAPQLQKSAGAAPLNFLWSLWQVWNYWHKDMMDGSEISTRGTGRRSSY